MSSLLQALKDNDMHEDDAHLLAVFRQRKMQDDVIVAGHKQALSANEDSLDEFNHAYNRLLTKSRSKLNEARKVIRLKYPRFNG